MANVLLSNSTFIKSITNISDNVNDKYILPALREAQDINLCGIVGETLLNKIKDLIYEKEINDDENAAYKDLLTKCQYFLAYQTVSNLCVILSYKIDNIGLAHTSDENISYASLDEVLNQSDFYRNKADYYALMIQNHILNNRTQYPEVNDCVCNSIKANLYSANSCGVVLGGARGKEKPMSRFNQMNYIGK